MRGPFQQTSTPGGSYSPSTSWKEILENLRRLTAELHLPPDPVTSILAPSIHDRLQETAVESSPTLLGIPFIASPLAKRRVQFRFPRSKKRRIRKKWAKDPRNWREEDCAYLVNTALP